MSRFLIALLLCLFTLPVLAKNTILIVGDSLSAGYGFDLKKSWATLLQERLYKKNYAYQVINSSISGDTTSNGLARLPGLLKKFHPHITILELGGNDGLRGLSLDVIEKNLAQMIDLAKENGSQVLLLGVRLPPNYGPQYTQLFQHMFISLAKQKKISVVPLFLHSIDENLHLMQPDGIHPTVAAQAILLNNVWPTLEQMLRKP